VPTNADALFTPLVKLLKIVKQNSGRGIIIDNHLRCVATNTPYLIDFLLIDQTPPLYVFFTFQHLFVCFLRNIIYHINIYDSLNDGRGCFYIILRPLQKPFQPLSKFGFSSSLNIISRYVAGTNRPSHLKSSEPVIK
jgi:hypothetical protein